MKGVFSERPSYSAIHKWLARNHVKKEKCDHCESTRFLEWALKRGLTHQHDVQSYLTLCSSCHKKYDYTEERRRRLSESLKGRKILWKDKISAANKGRKLTETQKNNLSEYQKKHPRPRNEKGQFFKKGE